MKKVSLSTILFWVGLLITLFANFLATGALSVLFLLAIVGVALAGWQKIVGDREQKRQFEREQKRTDAVALNEATHAPERRIESNLNKAHETMPTRESQVTYQRNEA